MAAVKRRLSEDDRALWEAYVDDLTPLPGVSRQTPKKPPAEKGQRRVSAKPQPSSPASPRVKVAQLPLIKPDRKTARALGRGKLAIDRKIDLHGLTQAEAHALLKRAILDTRLRRLLVVTGRGSSKTEGGVLRTMLPRWLAEPEFAARVFAVGSAARGHGGDGAYYVLLRGPRKQEKNS